MKENKNSLLSLNDILFAELKGLNDPNLKGEELKEKLAKAKAVTELSTKVIDNANTMLAAAKIQADVLGRSTVNMPNLFLGDGNEK